MGSRVGKEGRYADKTIPGFYKADAFLCEKINVRLEGDGARQQGGGEQRQAAGHPGHGAGHGAGQGARFVSDPPFALALCHQG